MHANITKGQYVEAFNYLLKNHQNEFFKLGFKISLEKRFGSYHGKFSDEETYYVEAIALKIEDGHETHSFNCTLTDHKYIGSVKLECKIKAHLCSQNILKYSLAQTLDPDRQDMLVLNSYFYNLYNANSIFPNLVPLIEQVNQGNIFPTYTHLIRY